MKIGILMDQTCITKEYCLPTFLNLAYVHLYSFLGMVCARARVPPNSPRHEKHWQTFIHFKFNSWRELHGTTSRNSSLFCKHFRLS